MIEACVAQLKANESNNRPNRLMSKYQCHVLYQSAFNGHWNVVADRNN